MGKNKDSRHEDWSWSISSFRLTLTISLQCTWQHLRRLSCFLRLPSFGVLAWRTSCRHSEADAAFLPSQWLLVPWLLKIVERGMKDRCKWPANFGNKKLWPLQIRSFRQGKWHDSEFTITLLLHHFLDWFVQSKNSIFSYRLRFVYNLHDISIGQKANW